MLAMTHLRPVWRAYRQSSSISILRSWLMSAPVITCLVALTVYFFVTTAEAANISNVSDKDLDGLVASEAARVQAAFSVSASWQIVATGVNESRLDTGVRISREAIARDLQFVPPEFLADGIRWLVAHEYWHQVQFRVLGPLALQVDNELRKVLECEADLMAGKLLGSDKRLDMTNFDTTNPDSLDYVLEIPSRITPSGSSATHPTAAQRSLATTFGVLKGILDYQRTASSDGAELAEVLGNAIDFQANEPEEEWRSRQCRRIVQYRQSAVGAIALRSPSIKWSKDPANQIVVFKLPYQNTSNTGVRVSVGVFVAVDSGTGANGVETFFPLSSLSEIFEISPGGTHVVQGTLPFAGDSTDMVLLFARSRALISAEFIEGTQVLETLEMPTGESAAADAREFGTAIVEIVRDAPNLFMNIRGCGGRRCESKVSIPTAKQTDIVIENRTAEVTSVLYEGDSRQSAEETFHKHRKFLKDLWPDKRSREGDDDTLPEVEIRLTNRAKLKLYLYEHVYESNGEREYSVWLSIRSTLF
jgi:hypothetical protein